MRRGISILLALIFGMGPLAAALPGAEDAALPPCCRRQGAHHCAMAAHMAAMMAAMEADGKTAVSAPATCPLYPGATFALLLPAVHALTAEAEELPTFTVYSRAQLAGDSITVSSPGSAYAGRGPPVSIPS